MDIDTDQPRLSSEDDTPATCVFTHSQKFGTAVLSPPPPISGKPIDAHLTVGVRTEGNSRSRYSRYPCCNSVFKNSGKPSNAHLTVSVRTGGHFRYRKLLCPNKNRKN